MVKSTITFKEYLKFEYNRYRSMSIFNVSIAIFSLVLFYYFTIVVFDFYMKKIILTYVVDIDNIESYKGNFAFINFNLVHFFIFNLINVIALVIYKLDFIPKKYRIQESWPWENNEKKSEQEIINNSENTNNTSAKDEFEEKIYKDPTNSWDNLKSETIKTLIINMFIIVPVLSLPFLFLNMSVISLNKIDFQREYVDYFKYEFLLYELIPQLTFLTISEDTLSYFGHKLMHSEYFYKAFHKKHHMYKSTVSWASEYAHPVEYVTVNITGYIIGVLILNERIKPFTFVFYTFYRILSTCEGHCGYNNIYSFYDLVPFSDSCIKHNYHHFKFKGNFSSFYTIWDLIMGTFNPVYIKEILIPEIYGKEM